ncbi:MAG: hypothetical protein QOI09_1518, partial [Chloroflexota bacterium]|nr:hypothetical protein [Chloroflexota bacterium]
MRRAALTLLIAGLIGIAYAAIAIANKGSARDPVGDVKHNPPGKDA